MGSTITGLIQPQANGPTPIIKGFCLLPVGDLKDQESAQKPFPPVDQIQYIIDSLTKAEYTRRAQAITWMPTADIHTEDPPCLQRIWCRLVEDESGEIDSKT